jgi:hypothetical protein
VETGRLVADSDPGKEVFFLEIRDLELPLALALLPSGAVQLIDDDDRNMMCRILMRPEGVQVCNKCRPGTLSGPLAYSPLLPGEKFDLGRTSFRYLELHPPVWTEKLAGVAYRQRSNPQ